MTSGSGIFTATFSSQATRPTRPPPGEAEHHGAVPALTPGGFSQGEVMVKVPSKTPVGPHYLLACADENATVTETDEGNNCGASATQVNIIPTGSGPPNLTPYKPSGWSGKIVVARTTGTVKDATPLHAADTLYVDWAVTHDGNAPR